VSTSSRSGSFWGTPPQGRTQLGLAVGSKLGHLPELHDGAAQAFKGEVEDSKASGVFGKPVFAPGTEDHRINGTAKFSDQDLTKIAEHPAKVSLFGAGIAGADGQIMRVIGGEQAKKYQLPDAC
jgi:hypothetical protein